MLTTAEVVQAPTQTSCCHESIPLVSVLDLGIDRVLFTVWTRLCQFAAYIENFVCKFGRFTVISKNRMNKHFDFI